MSYKNKFKVEQNKRDYSLRSFPVEFLKQVENSTQEESLRKTDVEITHPPK